MASALKVFETVKNVLSAPQNKEKKKDSNETGLKKLYLVNLIEKFAKVERKKKYTSCGRRGNLENLNAIKIIGMKT